MILGRDLGDLENAIADYRRGVVSPHQGLGGVVGWECPASSLLDNILANRSREPQGHDPFEIPGGVIELDHECAGIGCGEAKSRDEAIDILDAALRAEIAPMCGTGDNAVEIWVDVASS